MKTPPLRIRKSIRALAILFCVGVAVGGALPARGTVLYYDCDGNPGWSAANAWGEVPGTCNLSWIPGASAVMTPTNTIAVSITDSITVGDFVLGKAYPAGLKLLSGNSAKTITMSGGNLIVTDFTGGVIVPNNLTLQGDYTYPSNGWLRISGGGGLSPYKGTATVQAGIIHYTYPSSMIGPDSSFIMTGGSVIMERNGATMGSLTLNGGAFILGRNSADSHAFTFTISSLTGTGSYAEIKNQGTAPTSIHTLVIDQSDNTTYVGKILGAPTVGSRQFARIVFQKAGSGDLTLTGKIDLRRTTAVSGGRLYINSDTAAFSDEVGTTAISVGGGTLGGTGTVTVTDAADVVLSGTGKLAAGIEGAAGRTTYALNGGTLDVSAVTAGTGTGWLKFDLGRPATPGVTYDQIQLSTGALRVGENLDFDAFDFNLLEGFSFGTYILFETGKTIGGSLGKATGKLKGFDKGSAELRIDGNNLVLVVHPLEGTVAPPQDKPDLTIQKNVKEKSMNNSEIISIGNRREVFWDDALVDNPNTTATLRMHTPQPREVVLKHDAPWEGDGCDFHCIVKDEGLYRLYYLAWEMMPVAPRTRTIVVAYAESTDGLHWVKPNLGLCEFAGSTQNNIILDEASLKFDNFFVFKDSNPACPTDEVYKGVGVDVRDDWLWCFTSADGIRFKKAWRMTNQGKFDTLNVALWDPKAGRYRCYIRDFHTTSGEDFAPGAAHLASGIRDIRWMESADFKTWTPPVQLDFGNAEDYPLYTNVIQPYYRAEHIFIGFPSRYVERKAWTPNFDQLPGVERRKTRTKRNPRYGLTLTDCVFMSSRDGKRWKRWDEAFMTPGPEREYNWVYGDCFATVGMIETPSALPHAPDELSLYTFDNHWAMKPAELRRYTLRIDGFASYHATYKPCQLALKPFRFEGHELSINFATSAAGYIKIALQGGGRTIHSCELFGDSLDRRVPFEDGEVASFAGIPVTMTITMSDADIYSFQFKKPEVDKHLK